VSDYETFMREHVAYYDRDVEHYPYSLPHNAVRFDNIDHLRRAVAASGNSFFGAEEMRMFGSRVDHALYGGALFITSEKPPHSPREYSVRWVYGYNDGDRYSIGRLDTRTDSLNKARTLARHALAAINSMEEEK
jgi:hypothetical protein